MSTYSLVKLFKSIEAKNLAVVIMIVYFVQTLIKFEDLYYTN